MRLNVNKGTPDTSRSVDMELDFNNFLEFCHTFDWGCKNKVSCYALQSIVTGDDFQIIHTECMFGFPTLQSIGRLNN